MKYGIKKSRNDDALPDFKDVINVNKLTTNNIKSMKKLLKLSRSPHLLLKFDLKMKLSVFFIFAAFFAMQANMSYSQHTKISLDLDNVSVERLLDEIENQTEFRFVYKVKDVDLNRIVTINTKRERILSILNRVFNGTKTSYNVIDRQIFLTEKTESSDLNEQTSMDNTIQEQTISGQITDSDGAPLPGANIVEKGTSNGTQSDFDGNFTLAVADSNTILVVSYIGFITKEVAVEGRGQINVQLIPDTAALDEVVIVGYGTQKKSDVTGAISQIKLDGKSPGAFSRLDHAISGRASGIQVVTESGDPGSTTNIRIRGTGTLGNNQPLWVVDGFPTIGNPTNSLNLNDIESIEVLKSTSAAAIYGARASNGVVIITTKRGSQSKLTASYDSYIGFQQNPKHYDVLSVNDYVDLQAELGNDLEAFRNESFVDWQDQIVNKSALIQNHNVNVSGGSENSNFNVSANYFNQESISKQSEFNRYSVRINSDFKVGKSKRLRFGESMQLSVNESASSLPGTNGQIGRRTFTARNAPFFQPFGDDLFGFNPVDPTTAGAAVGTTSNVLAAADSRISDGQNRNFRILGNIYGELELLKNLKYRLTAGVDYLSSNGKGFGLGINNLFGQRVGSEQTRFSRGLSNSLTTNVIHTLKYDNTFGKHTIGLLAGYEETVFETESTGITGVGFEFDQLRLASQGESITNSEGIDQFSLVGWLGRLNYNYDDRYLVTLNVRNDKSSRFGPGFQSQTFPSFSLGWNLSNEDFFPENEIFTRVKLRGGWGQSGNQFTGDNFAYVASLHLFSNVIFGENQTSFSTPVPLGLTASDITWEVVEQTDFGIDLGLFNNKVDLTLEFYNRQTKDILLSVIPPGASGAGLSEILINAGEVSNKGFEFAGNYNFSIGKVDFNLGANLTTLENNVDALNSENATIVTSVADDFTETNITQVGSAIGSFYGWVTDGIFQSQAEIDAHATQVGAEPGDIRFKDLDGNGEINGDDRTVLGKSIPGFYYGFNLGANYKSFDFAAQFQGVGDIQLLNGARFELERMRNTSNQLTSVLNRWTPENPSNSIPRAVAGDPNGNGRMSDRWVEDAAYLRLRNIQLGYTFPEKTLNRVFNGHIHNLRVYGAVQNAFTITNYSGLDPEATVGINFVGASDSPLSNGQDDGRTPTPRTLQFGLQVTF